MCLATVIASCLKQSIYMCPYTAIRKKFLLIYTKWHGTENPLWSKQYFLNLPKIYNVWLKRDNKPWTRSFFYLHLQLTIFEQCIEKVIMFNTTHISCTPKNDYKSKFRLSGIYPNQVLEILLLLSYGMYMFLLSLDYKLVWGEGSPYNTDIYQL